MDKKLQNAFFKWIGRCCFCRILVNWKSDKYEIDEDIVLAFESKSGKAHTLEGKIVRKDKEGIGVRFEKELIAIALKHAEEWL